ncbi:MAG: diphosphomevalonate decarboxylase [Thermoplasmata archaeon]|nr:diphosphomevalonate decarboxylase [Thermoplasmata archaeon]
MSQPFPPARFAGYEAAPNIALVKYWGMRDDRLVLPRNSSLSMTVSRLRTRTWVRFDPSLRSDRFSLNGRPAGGGPLQGAVDFLDVVREEAGVSMFAEIRSHNNFPTASGLASSASGFAALAGAASLAAGLRWSPREMSRLARRGSGSASRSIFGGFVEWQAGRRPDGRDCFARPLFRADHWPELRDIVVLIADAPEKRVRSARAMQETVRTSPAYSERQRTVAGRLAALRTALRTRSADRFLALIMEECDDFRRVCETTVPSLDYLTPSSRAVLAAVLDLNRRAGHPVAGYTHDAGAHVHVFTFQKYVPRVRSRLRRIPGVSATRVLSPGPAARVIGVRSRSA